MRLTFIQLAAFVADWRELRLTDDDLRALEIELLVRPESGRVIPGAGGLRKTRFAPPSLRTGKRGGTRVVYAYFPVASHVYLFAIYAKNVQEDLTPAEKKLYREVLLALRKNLAEAWVAEE
jgi:hypothetical protein